MSHQHDDRRHRGLHPQGRARLRSCAAAGSGSRPEDVGLAARDPAPDRGPAPRGGRACSPASASPGTRGSSRAAPINASTQVLDAVARTLKLDQPEREHLYRLADVPEAAAAAEGAAQIAQVAPELQRILDGAGHAASQHHERAIRPAGLERRLRGAVPGGRAAARVRAEHAVAVVHLPACCHPYLNRDEQLGMLVVAQLRAAYGRHVGEPAWTKFVRRLQAASPEFAQAVGAARGRRARPRYLKIFRHPAHDRLVMTTHLARHPRRARHQDGRLHPGRRRHLRRGRRPDRRRGRGRAVPVLGPSTAGSPPEP